LAQTTLDPGRTLQERLEKWRQAPRGSSGWRVADLLRAGSALGDAIAGHRILGREDRAVLSTTAILVLALALLSLFFPWVVGSLVAVIAGWFGVVLGIRALGQARRARKERKRRLEEDAREPGAPGEIPGASGEIPGAYGGPEGDSGEDTAP
jgi:hypothetical protein